MADLQLLLDRRAAAWRACDPDLLGTVVLPGSSAQTSERAALERARREGITYDSVAFKVEALEILSAHDDVIVVQARVWSGQVNARKGGELVHRTPEREDDVRIEIAAGDDGWLLQSWEGLSR